jgi:branched-chain amino acid transport system permease protein
MTDPTKRPVKQFVELLFGRAGKMAVAAIGAALVVYLFLLPSLPGTADARLFTLTLMFTTIAVAINWNLTGGFTGYVDFGHAVWFGLGAYTTAVLMSLQSELVPQEFPLIPSVVAGAIVAGLVANLVGRMTMRLSGPYFSIAMLGFFVFVREVVRVWRPLTNGGTGLTLPPTLNRPLWYYVELVLVLLLLAFSWWLRRTRFGASLIAIREDEVGAEMRGINTTRSKVMIFSFSAFSTGLFGGMWAYQNTFVDPDIAFVEVRTIDAVLGTMLGGLGTILGPVVGSGVLYSLREVLWANFLDYHLIVQGVLLGLIVMYLPKGLMGLLRADSRLFSFLLGRDGEQDSAFDSLDDAGAGSTPTLGGPSASNSAGSELDADDKTVEGANR